MLSPKDAIQRIKDCCTPDHCPHCGHKEFRCNGDKSNPNGDTWEQWQCLNCDGQWNEAVNLQWAYSIVLCEKPALCSLCCDY